MMGLRKTLTAQLPTYVQTYKRHFFHFFYYYFTYGPVESVGFYSPFQVFAISIFFLFSPPLEWRALVENIFRVEFCCATHVH